ncbi:MAG TPA: hypothetical protein PLZ93_11435 [Nocardioides sp.]|uniref:hypothetical protein n=1 Tax=uncultured Nocardioides sp. TaxID=198441 RepID=UPI00262CEAFA|nr:hypothetical protein [uncultured Nocardioides sp.]HRD60738.1 hypothetical protein [Nocardioides sp.]HRI96220.1 hypothetical protein [Nocardioides sp.]HRK45199.1 hypothetical protein [Nocardioides sp.]
MSQAETPADFHLRLRGAQLHLELDRRRGDPSPDWVHALLEEGERRSEGGREPS